MKKLIFTLAIIIGISTANAQTTPGKEKSGKSAMALKEHVCSAACVNGNHVYLHGEKGHTCTASCKKMDAGSSPMALKDHQCTAACKNGNHVYAHGEKGHTCTPACKKNM